MNKRNSTNAKPGKFLVPWNERANDRPALVCIPWAGAGAAPFRPWGPVLGDVATVYGLRLAGRESRRTEPPADTVSDVVTDVVTELADLGVPRVALFGQCSGAVLAFELAKALAEPGRGVDVTRLVVASQRPPRDLAATDLASEQDPTPYVPAEFRAEPDLVELLLPIIAADIDLVSRYAYEPGRPLDVPVTVVYGADDEVLGRAEVDGWRLVTTGPTSFHEIAGGHHLLGGDAWRELAETVRAALE